MHIDVALINESQLGNRLNQAIEHNRRGEFGLLLSMLSNDARDMAQFQLDKQLDSDDKLRAKFELSQEQALVGNLATQDIVQDNSQAFSEGGCSHFNLIQALTPEALVIRGQNSADMAQTLANCDNVTRLREIEALPEPKVELSHFSDLLSEQRQFALVV